MTWWEGKTRAGDILVGLGSVTQTNFSLRSIRIGKTASPPKLAFATVMVGNIENTYGSPVLVE